MSRVDLHTHSSASDGSLTPTELIALARRSGLEALALTDHDTVQGLSEAIQTGQELGVEVIPGCELSVQFSPGIMHIVGLWLPCPAQGLEAKFRYLVEKRHQRNQQIIDKLQSLGLQIGYQQVKDLAGKATIGRPHLAQILVQNQIVQDVAEAFDYYLGPDGLAFVPKVKLTPRQALEALRDEQATTILAHPATLDLEPKALERELLQLKGLGLEGLEVYSSIHTPQQTQFFKSLAKRHKLLISGGSDYHGIVKPDIQLGRGKGNLEIPYRLVAAMKEARLASGLWITTKPR